MHAIYRDKEAISAVILVLNKLDVLANGWSTEDVLSAIGYILFQ